MFSVELEGETGVLVCRCEGHLTIADVVEYGRQMRVAVDRARRRLGNVRVIVHANSAVQTGEVMEAVTQHTWQPGPGDRMAFIVTSALAKLQAARLFDATRARPFLTEAEAVEWLLGDDFAIAAMPAYGVAYAQAKGV